MKKLITVLTVAGIMAASSLSGVCASDVQILNKSKILQINEDYGSKTNVTVTIAPVEQKNINTENLPKFMYPYNSDANGILNLSITLSDKWESGRYNAYIDSPVDESARVVEFIYVNPRSTATLLVIDAVNKAEDGEGVLEALTKDDGASKVGIDINSAEFTEFGSDASKYVIFVKDGDYTFETFLKMFETGLKTTPLVEEIKSTETYGDLRNIVEKNAAVIGISFEGDYKEVDQKYMVYAEMFENREAFTDIFSVAGAFKDAVAAVIEAQEEEEEESSGSSSGRGSSGKGSSSKGGSTVVFPTTDPVVTKPVIPVPSVPVYSDLSGHFSESAVKTLSEKNILSGYPDKTFRPSNSVTRAEFAKIAAIAFGFEPKVTGAFGDVGVNEWFAGYVDVLNAEGIVGGFDGKFNPHSTITRQDAASIIYRIVKDKLTLSDKEAFSDEADVSDYAKEAVEGLHKAGVINGNGNVFSPLATITRGEVAVMVANAMSSVLK